MDNRCRRILAVALLVATLIAGRAAAQNVEQPSAEVTQSAQPAGAEQDLAKAVQNPVSNLVSVPVQENMDFGIGPFGRVRTTTNLQPVYPASITSTWNLIARVILPIVYQPDVIAEDGGTFGLGDTSATFFVSPARPGAVIWGLGPAFLVPSGTADVLGTGKWSAGPSAVVLIQPAPWTVGVLANNVWSFAGNDGRPSVNQFLLQYFVNYNLPTGWFITSSPILTASWEANGEQWVVPFGAGIGKVFKIAGQAMNGQVSGFYNAIRPEAAPDWQLRLQLALLFPKTKKD
jgi:hypothetical protein